MILHIKETHSTNQLLTEKMQAEELADYTTLWADYQTAGRGQQGNHWESERAQNLCFSILVRPDFLRVEDSFLISKAVALGIADTLGRRVDGIRIKWPNDIYHNDHKIAGILIENQWQGEHIASSIIGIGLNVNQRHFLSDAPNPISLFQITGVEESREELLKEIITDIYHRIEQLRHGLIDTLNDAYFNQLYRNSGYHRYIDAHGSTFEARTLRVDNDGSIQLQERNGSTHSFYFKEVSILR